VTVCLFTDRRSELVAAPARPPDVHAPPDARAGKGVPLQPLPVAAAARRAVRGALPYRAPGEDLVPESAHEGKKGDSRHQGAERAGSQGARDAPPPPAEPQPPTTAAAAATGSGRGRRRRRGRDVMGYVTRHRVTLVTVLS